MGASGTGSFENDSALDWISGFADEPDRETLRETLSTVANWPNGNYLDSDESTYAVAAAEVVAAILGRPGPGLPEETMRWAHKQPTADGQALQDGAVRALQRVLKKSELKESWDASQHASQWYQVMDGLLARVRGGTGQ